MADEQEKLPSLKDIVLGLAAKQKKLHMEHLALSVSTQEAKKHAAKINFDRQIKAADDIIAKVNEIDAKYDSFTKDEIEHYIYELESGRNPTLRG